MKFLLSVFIMIFIILIGCDYQKKYDEQNSILKYKTISVINEKTKDIPVVNSFKQVSLYSDTISNDLNNKIITLNKYKKTAIDSINILKYRLSKYTILKDRIAYVTTIKTRTNNSYIILFDFNFNIIKLYSNYKFINI